MRNEHRRSEGLRALQRGLTLERANRLTAAASAYRTAIDAYPLLAEAHVALGTYYQRTGMLTRAEDEFRTVVSLEGDFLAFFNLGYVQNELHHYDDALSSFQQCLNLAPLDTATHFELAVIYHAQGDYKTALHYLQLPLVDYTDEWEVYSLVGKCCLGLQRYDDALTALGRAMLLANELEVQADLLGQIIAVQRRREFRHLYNAKDIMYAQQGVMYVGSAQDNGLRLGEAQTYHFGYADISTTIQRLLAFNQGCQWRFSAVVSIDTLSRPLAAALAHLMNLPFRTMDELGEDDAALLVMAVAREGELLQLALERAPCMVVTFCLGLNWPQPTRPLPNIIGIMAREACSVPWEADLRALRVGGGSQANIDSLLAQAQQQVLASVQAQPDDHTLPRQVRYYMRTHRRLSFPTP